MNIIDILSQISTINRDNGKRFTQTNRLDEISSLLWNSNYRRINNDGLFNLYSKKPISELLYKDITVVSTHIDCEKNITRCFSTEIDSMIMRGTYDNSATNAVAISAMLSNELPDNVLIAFTGDEEESSRGAKHLIKFLKSKDIKIKVILVLDVTDMGWIENADFTIENNFWRNDTFGANIINIVNRTEYVWRFIPCDVDNIPTYIPPEAVIYNEAEEDESWFYDEKNQNCFSLCLPVHGEMHSDEGVIIRKNSLYNYYNMLVKMLTEI